MHENAELLVSRWCEGDDKKIDFERMWISLINREYFGPTTDPVFATGPLQRRRKTTILVIGPGFGIGRDSKQWQVVKDSGYKVEEVHVPDPTSLSENEPDEKMKDILTKMESVRPVVVLGASKGGKYLIKLWEKKVAK